MEFSKQTRSQSISRFSETEFDLLIVGGGISGAGVARDAASRGMRVALVEAQDFAEGTSSRSSKLIHGGIRYLENLEFSLVFEALTERKHLFEMAPHLVHPLRFQLPIYKDSRVGMFKMGLGMWLYDALSAFEAPQMHERLNKAESLERAPLLNSKDLCGSYVYSDAYMDDDRLVIETLRSAARMGATVANYVSAQSAEFVDGKIKSLNCKDELTNVKFQIRARHIVSTVGPWTDIFGHKIIPHWRRRLRPSKGVHLCFSRDRLKLEQAVVMVSDDQKRIVFAIPRHEMVIVGTTDTDFPSNPESVSTNKEDVRYLLHVAENYFPGAKLKEDDILSSYSGVRPLVDDGSESESKTSREHTIFTDPSGVTFVAGGKYTTYRKISEQTVHEVLLHFPKEQQAQFLRNNTLSPLNPLATVDKLSRSKHKVDRWSHEFGLDVDTVHTLVERHGEEALKLLESHSHRVRQSEHPLWQIEALHAIQSTMCLTLKDFYLRRSPLFLANKDHGLKYLSSIAEIFRAELGINATDDSLRNEAIDSHLRHEMSWRS